MDPLIHLRPCPTQLAASLHVNRSHHLPLLRQQHAPLPASASRPRILTSTRGLADAADMAPFREEPPASGDSNGAVQDTIVPSLSPQGPKCASDRASWPILGIPFRSQDANRGHYDCCSVLDALYWRRLGLNDALRQQLSELPGTKTLVDLSERATSLGEIRVCACPHGRPTLSACAPNTATIPGHATHEHALLSPPVLLHESFYTQSSRCVAALLLPSHG
jgi:hypothetical protein